MSPLKDLEKQVAGLSPAKRALLERLRKPAGATAPPAIRQYPRRDGTPLSFAQQRLWLIYQLDPSSYLYNVPRAVRMKGKLDLAAMERSLNEIVRRHEVLRTTVVAEGDQPVQQIASELFVPLPVTDLGRGDRPSRETEIQRLAVEEIRKPFDLARGPLLRARVLRLGEEDHVLVLAMHHIVSDGWTAGILFEELGAFYEAFTSGRAPALPELPVQYADYAQWQREWMQGGVLEEQLAYWRTQMAGAPAMLELPSDRPRPEVSTYRGRRASLLLPGTVSDALKNFSRRQGTTLFTTMLAGLKILLSRWSGQHDVVVGTVSGNRNQTEIEKLVGCFMNFLPLRDTVSEADSAQELLSEVHQTVLGAYAHQDCPFEKIIEALSPQRALNVNPLYNVALLMQNFPELAFRSETLDARFLSLDTEVAFLDLRFVAAETAAGIQVECEYGSDLFDAGTIEQLLNSYQSVLEKFAAAAESKVAEFELSEPLQAQASAARKREQKQTIAIAATFTAEPVEESLAFWMKQLGMPVKFEFAAYNQVFQQLFDPASLMASNGDGFNVVLVRLEDWQELDGKHAADKIEHNVHELIGALQGAALRSAAPHILCLCPASRYALADPQAAALLERMESLLVAELNETPGAHVIPSARLLDLYPVADYDDEYADKLGHIPYTPALFTALGTVIARRIYSLRSAPRKVIVLDCDQTLWKGVCGEDGPLGVEVDAPRRALQEFMVAQYEAGMVLCLCSKNIEEDVVEIFEQNPGMLLRQEHIVSRRINWQSKSVNLRELAEELQLGLDSFVFIDDNPLECAELRANCPEVLTLELPVNPHEIPQFLRHVWALDHGKITEEDRKRTSLYLQNMEREELRKGSQTLEEFLAGLELQIDIRPASHDDLARVSQLAERTNQFNFTTLRRSESEIEKLLQSGSECLVVNLKDRFGDYGIVGVMIYAVRQDVLEVDTFLLSCRALGRKVEHQMLAALGQIAQERGLKRVDAPFAPTKKNKPAFNFLQSVGEKFKASRDGRTVYNFPSAYAAEATKLDDSGATESVVAQKAPAARNSSQSAGVVIRIASELCDVGKISHAIESQKQVQARPQRVFAAPRAPEEEILAGIWARMLRMERVGIYDDFFALGGHSLLATQVIARIRRAFGVELPLRAMFEAPTVAQLRERIERERDTGRPKMPPLARVERKDHLPLSFAQQRLWFLDQLEPGNPLYNIPQMIRMRGRLNLDALQRSIHEVVRRHEALRTCFVTVENEPVQVIVPQASVTLATVEISHLQGPQREQEVQRLTREEALRPFDLSKGPLLRASLLRLGAEEHVLLLNMHHVVSDRWSMGVLSEELAALYGAFVANKPSPLPELPLQYADYAMWQRQLLQGEVLQEQIAYWKKQLSGAPQLLELPTDRSRPAAQSYRGASATQLLSKQLVAKLTALSQSEGVTLFMALLAAFQTLLSRYSGQEDIVVGSPIANRSHAEIEPLIGFFVNTLALRGDLSGDPSFRELLARVKEVSLGAYAHQDIPFERLVEELQPERSLSYNPVFQVLFALQNAPLQALELPGLQLEPSPVYTGTSMFDTSWFAIEVPDGLLLRAEYNTDLFEASTITRALAHFETLLEGIAAHPEKRLSQLPLLNGAERERVLVEFNDTAAAFPGNFCVHDFFEAQVQRTPDSTALICDQQRVSYRELNRRANQLAHFLQKRGVGPEVLVGICSERSVDMLVGILGIMKAGGAYVPLDPAYPKERLACILEDAKAPVLLTQRCLLDGLPEHTADAICLDSDWSAIVEESEAKPARSVQPENLAYVLFTSGSTGRPKGVALEHRSAATFMHWAQTVFTGEELAGTLFSTSVCFDLSVFEMFVPLSVGGTVIIAPNALYLPTLPAKDEVTLINTVPSAIAELVRINGVPASVKTVNLAGEALPDALVKQIYGFTSVEKVYNLYGPTEDTTYSTYTLVPRGARVHIGRPLANTQAYILDGNRYPVPVGVAGELYLAGEGLARGYFGRPDLTEERFVANPFSGERSARMYRTGDLCRWLPDGNIQYLGRIDNQVKLRGFRIELGEIEAVLAKHPGVRQSVVMVREDQPGLKQLVAYVAAKEEAPTVESLRERLKASLPEFMVPAAFVMMEALPLTPNGKVNRRALPVPEFIRESAEMVAPRTPIEENVAKIWAEVLRLDRVGVHDDFFAMGGHSLLATQVISRLRQAFQVELPLRAIFEAPTVAKLAGRLDSTVQPSPDSAPIPRAARNQALPLSYAQQRLWFLDQLEPNNPLYNIPWSLRVRGRLHAEALESALNTLVARHEALRTTFSTVGDQPVQVISPSLRIPLAIVDLSDLPPNEREARAERLLGEEAQRPFNLSSGPLLRATLLRLGHEDHVLLLNIHHIVSDRWSMGVLSQELAALYAATLEGKASPLAELPVQYADFAVWQRQWRPEEMKKHLAYWKEQLQGASPVLELPTDRPRLAAETFRGSVEAITLPKQLSERLESLSRDRGVTLFMTLLAGFQALLARYSGQDDIVVGAPIANRNRAETEGLIGFFANTLALRAKLSEEITFNELLAQVKETALGAYAHQDMPFEKLVEELRPERSLSHNPLVQVFFALQNAPMETLQLKGLSLKPIESETKTAKGDLFFSLVETAHGLRGRLEYSTDLFDAATIKRLLGHYQVLLEAAVANPGLRLSELPLLTAGERRQLLVDWNATEFEYPRHFCLHQLFEQQVERTPQAAACEFEGKQLSYAELNARANQVAHYLKRRGVGRGQRVGIFVERSLEVMVGLLGIQKAGAAYVPLDPAYPAERVRLTLEDAQVAVLLSQQSLLAAMPEHQAEVVCLDSDWPKIAQESTANGDGGARPEDLVYVIFTSGSTGRPKGVQVPHRAVVNLLSFMAKELRMGADDVFPALASFAFDMCIPELYLALVTGGRVVIGHRHLAANGEELAVLLRKSGASVVHATPTTWNLLLQAGFTGKGLKRVIGAEPLPRELCTRLLEADDSLYNFYGPTETTVWSTYHHFRSPQEAIVVGRPLANTQVYILEKRGEPVPVGVWGEIHIGGEGVSCGYLSRPELTAEKFIADRFSKHADAKLYKTGDVGRWLADGRIEFQGRVDHQVKIRGYRIELGEIEAVVGQHGSVKECVVVAREDVAGDKRLVGYVVPAAGQRVNAAELRGWVKERLPEYMAPVAWVEMERLPLSPNGKVDRRNLPAPDYVRGELARAYQGARTPGEEVIAGTWAEVLQLDRVGVEDDFFELGGHSLLATQVVSRIRQAFQVELPLRALFEVPTVAGLAERVDGLQREGQGLQAPPIKPVSRQQTLPLSFAQQRLWFLDQLEPNNPLYNVPYIVRLRGRLEVQVLEKSLQEIMRRHESLRTRFETLKDNDEPAQVIAAELRLPLAFTDLTSLPEAERESSARTLAMEEVKRPFDLKTGPLLRASIFKLGDDDHVLILNTHHIISDRWSLGVLSQELAALYEAFRKDQPSPLAELPIQYADYAVWQRQFLAGDRLEKQLAYWRQQLEGAPAVLELPTDRPRQALENFWGGVHTQPLATELIKDLRSLSRRNSATFFMTLLAAFQVLLARYSGKDDIVIGTDLANRTQVDTEKLIGFFVNLLPVRGRPSGDLSFREFLAQVREASLGAFAHQDVPFEKLVEELRPERSLTHNPLVQVLFVMQNTPQMQGEFGGLKAGPLGVSSTSRFDLVLFVNDPEGSAFTSWMYNPNLFDASTIERLAAMYDVLLRSVATDPEMKLASLSELLAEAERQQRAAEQKEFQEASLRKLKKITRRAVIQT